jgi:hypothetical protein
MHAEHFTSAPTNVPMHISGCTFSDAVPKLAAAAWNITFTS